MGTGSNRFLTLENVQRPSNCRGPNGLLDEVFDVVGQTDTLGALSRQQF